MLKEDWLLIYRDRMLMEYKIYYVLEIMLKKYYLKVDVFKIELDKFVYLVNESFYFCCYVNDILNEFL